MVLFDNIKSNILREKYIKTFINVHSPIYMKYISNKKKYVDGWCYIGYLWDCFLNFRIIDEYDGIDILKSQKEFYVFWDIHSCENILIPHYWKFPKENFIKINYLEFISIRSQLPEDIYVFTDDMSFSIAFTHEYDKDKRFCYLAMPSISSTNNNT